jgi:thioredoxin family protein
MTRFRPPAALVFAVLVASGGVAACGGAQPGEVWTMPSVPLAADAPPAERNHGMPFTYTGAAGVHGGDAMKAEDDEPGDLPETGFAPTHGFWRSDERAAAREAKAYGKGLLVSFFAEWCDECRRLERDTLRDPEIRRVVVGRFVPLRIDLTEETRENREQSERYAVSRVPSLLVLDAAGRELYRFEAYVPPDTLLGVLAPAE